MNKVFHVMYDDDDKLMEAARELVGKEFTLTKFTLLSQFTELIQLSVLRELV